uniref:Uncharacterized protein n=1 Tax=Thermosporothrix sp. COM3 TaxID=2490863 RepID=A0A455SIC0_9CHLR|nr:hypothetical protein KTC_22270 [Thermosporothrix sp. COM3]
MPHHLKGSTQPHANRSYAPSSPFQQRLSRQGNVIAFALLIIALLACSAPNTPQPAQQATTLPQPTSTLPLTLEGQIERQAAQATRYGHAFFAFYTDTDKKLTMEETLRNGTGTVATIKEECLRMHKLIWHNQERIGLDSFMLQLYDKASSKASGYVGVCQMRKEQAQAAPWDTLNAEAAWKLYESKNIF